MILQPGVLWSFDKISHRFRGGGSPAKLPPPPAPAPTPGSIREGAVAAGARERLSAKRRKGRGSLILTDAGTLGTSPVQRQSLLGDTGI